jgi:hypothetical protein
VIEFLPESVDNDATEELLSGVRGRPARRLVVAGVLVGGALVAALVTLVNLGSDSPARPQPASAPSVATADQPLPRLPGVRALPVYGLALLGRSTWVLQRDGVHVLRPGRRAVALPAHGPPQTWETSRVTVDRGANLVWLVSQRRAWAYAPDTRIEFTGTVPAFSDVAALDGKLYLAAGSELVEAGPGVGRPRLIFEAPGPLATVAADPTRHRLIVAYQNGPSRIFALRPTAQGPARVLRTATVRSINATIAVAGGTIWFAGFSTGGGALMRLDAATLRPDRQFAYQGSLGSGGVLVAEGTSSVWVRQGIGGPDLRCVDARTGAQAQVWTLDGVVASTAGRAVLGTGTGPVQIRLDGCPG